MTALDVRDAPGRKRREIGAAPSRAIILAAGRVSGLRPYSDVRRKCLIYIVAITLLVRHIE
jgi:choline kinase